jgi:hypothetical protein
VASRQKPGKRRRRGRFVRLFRFRCARRADETMRLLLFFPGGEKDAPLPHIVAQSRKL